MTSQSSLSKKTFRSFFWKGLPIIIPQLAIAIGYFLLGHYNTIIDYNKPAPIPEGAPADYVQLKYIFVIVDSVISRPEVIPFIMTMLGLLTGILLFAFIDVKKMMNVYYSLAMKRSYLFTSVYMAGAVLLLIPCALPLIANAVLNVVLIESSALLWNSTLYAFLMVYSFTMLGFSIAALCMAGTGTIWEGALNGLAIASAPFLFGRFLAMLSRRFLKGSFFGLPFSDTIFKDTIPWGVEEGSALTFFIPGKFNPVAAAQTALNNDYLCAMSTEKNVTSAWNVDGAILGIVITFIITAVLAVLSVKFFEKRKAEFCGIPTASRGLNITASFIFGFYIFCLAVTNIPLESNILSALIALVIFAVFFILINILTEHSAEKAMANFKYSIIPAALICAVIIVFSTGGFGYSSYIPKAEDVKSARISAVVIDTVPFFTTGTSTTYYQSASFAVSPVYGRSVEYGIPFFCTFFDETEAPKVISLHEKMLNGDGYKKYYPSFHPVASRDIAVSYTLKDGRVVTRYFRNLDDKTLDEAILLLHNNIYKRELTKALDDHISGLNGNYILHAQSRFLTHSRSLNLTPEQQTELLEAAKKDIAEQTPEELLFPKEPILGYLGREFLNDEEMAETGDDFYEKICNSGALGYTLFPITPDMEKTYSLLCEWGYKDDLSMTPDLDTIEKINITPEENLYDREKFIPFFNSNMFDHGFYDFRHSEDEKVYKDESKVKTITDKNEMAKILSKANLYSPTTRGGYQVEIVLKENAVAKDEYDTGNPRIIAYLNQEIN